MRYVRIGIVNEVPETTGTVVFRRVRSRGNPEKLARRYAKRHAIPYEEALERYRDLEEKRDEGIPFVWRNSKETGQRMKLHVGRFGPERAGSFDSFGLGGAVPDF